MTVLPWSPRGHSNNQQVFETSITLTLQVVAAVEFAPVLKEDRPPRDVLLSFAAEVERHALEIAALSRHAGPNIVDLGRECYKELVVLRNEPLQVAYHALHSAAYLGLQGGVNTATMLAVVGYALRVLAAQEERLTH